MVAGIRYRPAEFFVLRSPLLPYDDILAWSAGLRAPKAFTVSPVEAAGASPADLDAAIAADRVMLRERLHEIVARPHVREALFVASPDLQGSYDTWHRDPDGRRGQRVERAIVRYLERMGARCTPFGLFAGCAVGTTAPSDGPARLTLPPRSAYRRHTRLDMHYLCGLIRALEADDTIGEALRYRPTTSLSRIAERWVWVELTPDDTAHSHRHHRLPATPALNALVHEAGSGLTRAELAALPGYSAALVDRRFLVSDLEPAVTGPETMHALIEHLDALTDVPAAGSVAETLRSVRDEIARLDAAGIGADPGHYQSALTTLRTLPAPVDPSKLWQGELIKTRCTAGGPDALTLGSDVLTEVERGARILHRLHHPRRDQLARFRDAFVTRYEGVEARRAVPLAEVLDPELGLGFGSSTGHDGSAPLVEGLELPKRPTDTTVQVGSRHSVLFRKLTGVLATGAQELVLTDADIDRLANPAPAPLPDAFSATCALVAESPEAVAAGQFRLLLEGVAGPSGARLSGRFCHGDAILRDAVQAYLRAEEALRPDAVFAEIAHLPEPRAGNVILRPVFRDYEIPYLASAGVAADQQITLDDLMVSVEGERVVLRSVRLNREIVPRLTSAQNYFHPRATPVYRFLAALQDQGVATGLSWDWGPLTLSPFLPRVRTGRIVLARARWRVSQDEIGSFGEMSGAALFRTVQAWRSERGVPRLVRLADADNELLINFDNIVSVEGFAQLVKARESAHLVEAYPSPDDLCVSGPEGRYFHELSIPFVGVRADAPDREAGQPSEPPTTAHEEVGSGYRGIETRSARMFPTGSEWLYAKLYSAPSMTDALLRRVVRPVVDRVIGSGAADRWFFIRYADPDWHLRLRFHGSPARLLGDVLPLLADTVAPFLERGEVRRFQLDTYDRELERYGGAVGTPLCEALFQEDSRAVLEIVDALSDDALPAARWKLAVPGMNALLTGLGLSLDEKLRVLASVRDGFAREHHADQKLLRQLGERYRSERPEIERLLDPTTTPDDPLASGLDAVRGLAARLAPIATRLRTAAERGDLTLPLLEIAPSLLHMHANRLLSVEARRQEMVLYDFLYRLYDAQAARTRPGSGAHDSLP